MFVRARGGSEREDPDVLRLCAPERRTDQAGSGSWEKTARDRREGLGAGGLPGPGSPSWALLQF